MTILREDASVMTRDGRAARILSVSESHMEGPYNYPILAEVEHPNKDGSWVRWHYLADGRWKSNETRNHNDLVSFKPWSPVT